MPTTRRPIALPGRAATRDDLPAITAVIGACELADDGSAEIDPSDVERWFALAGEGGVVVVEADGRVVAAAALVEDRAEVHVHPAFRGRGIGSELLAWAEARARERAVRRIRQTVTDSDRAAHRLLAEHGYEPFDTAWILEIELDDDPPAVVPPAGIRIRPFTLDDAPATFELIEDAFMEWPGRTRQSFDRWRGYVLDHAAFATDLSRLALDGDELVGAAIAYDYPSSAEGWVQQLATKATHRHRGIARALLASTFGAFHATGRRRVGLSTNALTGALTLYERLGMRVRRSYTVRAKELA